MFVSTAESEWDAVIRAHLKGHFCLSRQLCAHWRGLAKSGQTVDGRIINTSPSAGLLGSVAQSAYSAAKGGIAALILVQGAELGRYGITANAIAPAARTRMTEGLFGGVMARLGSAASAHVSGRMFEVAGGEISLADGWRKGVKIDRGARWNPAEVREAIDDLIQRAVPPEKVYGAR